MRSLLLDFMGCWDFGLLVSFISIQMQVIKLITGKFKQQEGCGIKSMTINLHFF